MADALSEVKKEYERLFHYLGEFEVKNKVGIEIYNVYDEDFGNPSPPSKQPKNSFSPEFTKPESVTTNFLKDWQDYLKLKELPMLGDIHGESTDIFEKFFYLSDEINKVTTILIDALCGPSVENIILHGGKGSGKTTYIYWFRKILSLRKPNFFDKYYIDILHLNRFQADPGSPDLIDIKRLNFEVWRMIKRYLESHDRRIVNEEKIGIIEKERDDWKKISSACDYIKDHKELKKFLFILDDVDVLGYKQLDTIAGQVFKQLGPKYIIKMMCTRTNTYEEARRKEGNYIDTYFQSDIAFGRAVALHPILEHRFRKVSNGEEDINPFSDGVCILIEKLANNDLRKALTMAKTILEELAPPRTKDKDIEKAKDLILSQSIEVLLEKNKIENIYTERYRIYQDFSLTREILLLLNYNKTIDERFMKSLRSRSLSADKNTVLETIEMLEQEGFIKKRASKKIYDLREKGKGYTILAYGGAGGYHEKCYEMLPESDYLKKGEGERVRHRENGQFYFKKRVVRNRWNFAVGDRNYAADYLKNIE